MAILPKLKLKAIVSFPSNVYGGTGIDVVKTNGNFTINLDYSEFPTSGTLPPNTNALVWDPVTDTYYLVPPSAVGGISDAPSDSKTYGRKNTVWVDAWASPVLTGNPTAPTPTAGDNDTSIATTAFVASAVSTVTLSGGVTYTPQSPTVSQQTVARQNIYAAPFDAMAYNGMQINGSMEVSQELGSTGTGTHGAYVVDGWILGKGGTMAVGAAQSPGYNTAGFTTNLSIVVGTAEPSIAAGDYTYIEQKIEGYRVARLMWGTAGAQPITIGFLSHHARAGVYTGVVRNQPPTRSYAFTYTQAAASTPQYNTITIPGDTAGTWAKDNTAGIRLLFAMACGTTNTAPSNNSWLAGSYTAGAGQVNAVAAATDVFRITGVVVLPGIEAPSAARSPLIMRPYDQELVTCQRYYQILDGGITIYSTAAGSTWGARVNYLAGGMRSAPSIVSPTWTYINGGSGAIDEITSLGFRFYGQVTGAGQSEIYLTSVRCDARL